VSEAELRVEGIVANILITLGPISMITTHMGRGYQNYLAQAMVLGASAFILATCQYLNDWHRSFYSQIDKIEWATGIKNKIEWQDISNITRKTSKSRQYDLDKRRTTIKTKY
jgi:hypothetical protein